MRCYDVAVRTTINLDDDVLEPARSIARLEGRSLGDVISDLARRGLAPSSAPLDVEEGFPVFHVRRDAPPITDRMVQAALEDP